MRDLFLQLARALLCLGLAWAGTVQAASYSASASTVTATTYPWIDISTTGSGLNLSDDVTSSAIALGFTFTLGNSSYTSVRIDSNGTLQFSSAVSAYFNSALPLNGADGRLAIDAVLLPLWDDLLPGNGQVRYRTQGIAPNRVFIVSWLAVPYYGGNSSQKATFQVQLYEQGQIVYRYGTVDGNGGPHNPTGSMSNPNGAVIGLELGDSDYVQYARNASAVPSGTTILWTRNVTPTPVLEYLFNESGWSGVSGEVKDTSGSGWHGTAAGLSATKPTTASASPAIAGSSGTCQYGVFNRSNKDYVSLPSSVPNLGASGSFTVTAWVRATNNALTGQRIFADDQNNSGGFILSLGDSGAGKLNFTSRGVSSQITLLTGAVINNNTWYFVAFGVDTVTKTKRIYVYDTAGTELAAVSANYTESSFTSTDAGTASIGGENNAAGSEANANFGFGGNIDEVRVYNAMLSSTELLAVKALTSTCQISTLLAEYRFEEASWNGTAGELKDSAGYTGGPYNGKAQGSGLPTVGSSGPARAGNPGTCGYANLPGPVNNGGSFVVGGLPVSTTTGAQTTVAFWMYWSGTDSVLPVGWNSYILGIASGAFGFNTANNDLYGISSTGLANGWHHVVAVFTNGSVTSNKIYLDGVAQTLTQRFGSPALANAVVQSTLTIGGYGAGTGYRFSGRLDEVRVYNGAISAGDANDLYQQTRPCAATLDHIEIRLDNSAGLTCAPSTFTVVACKNAACTGTYDNGVTGTLTATGTGMSVSWPNGAAFSIPAGSSSTTVNMQLTTAGSVLVGSSGLVPSATSATSCNFGSPQCTFSAAAAALRFDVPDHRAESSTPVSISAIGSSGGSCSAAFASSTRTVRFKCGYTNPSSGTRPVRVAGTALNTGNNSATACDANGHDVSLSFDANGVASTTLLYADAGRLQLSATYTGSAGTGDSGLTMTGIDSFIVAPYDFSVTGISSAAIAAGTAFSATVTARNYAGNPTPNFGQEQVSEGVILDFVRTHPNGSAAVNGNFSGSVGAFSGGIASASNLSYSEVGAGNVGARLASDSYLASGMTLAGSSEGDLVWCANEGGSCVLPAGATVTMYYQAWGSGRTKALSGLSGTVSCSNTTFGDPYVGWGKGCIYAATSGTRAWATAAATFKPHHFDVGNTPACGAFSYAGQAFTTSVTARNAAGETTHNYDGSANTSPNYAKATTLSEPNALGLGSLSGNSLAPAAYLAGVGTATVSYSFTNKTTAPQSLVLRATDTDAVSSLGYAETAMPLRSGRLRLSNAFGRATAALQVPVVAEYWGGSVWQLNSADSCTSLAAASVALSNPRSATGAVGTATTSAGALAISAGSGLITLAAPSPAGSSLSLDIALNLGSTTADLSCLASHPATTGGAKPWLRAQNGSCAATADRDPAGRVSFGIFSPETRKTVHVRDLF